MANIIVNHADELDAELTALARPLVAKWEAAVLRVAAAHVQPKFMPFKPSMDTPESILARRFSQLPAAKKQVASQRAITSLKAPNLQAQARLGLVGVDLTAARSIDQLMAVVPPKKLTKEQLTKLADTRITALGGMPQAGVGVPGSLKSLRLEMVRIVCVDETNGFLGWEGGEDEIKLGGAALDETTKVGKVGPFDLGDFDDGTRKDFFSPPKVLSTFDLTKAKSFPNAYFVTLVLVEHDHGNFNETVNEIVNKIKKEATEYLAALIGAQIGASGGVFGMIIGAIVGYVVGKAINAIVSVWEDDPFRPRTIEVIIPSADATFDGKLTQPSQVIRFTGPGEYAMRYQWALTK
jgi:hypothetical protein